MTSTTLSRIAFSASSPSGVKHVTALAAGGQGDGHHDGDGDGKGKEHSDRDNQHVSTVPHRRPALKPNTPARDLVVTNLTPDLHPAGGRSGDGGPTARVRRAGTRAAAG